MARRAAFLSLEPYRLTGVQLTNRELGVGSSAIVIELKYMGMKCAGKKIHENLLKCGGSEYTDATRQFSKECHILSRISHPNIVQFLGVYFQEEVNIPILVMEFLPTNLPACIKRHGNFPNEVKYSILHDIAQGLVYLHSQTPPIIHRDLSSNNILLNPILTAKIADLGVARILNMSPIQVSTMTQNPGTPIYMPPEAMVADPHYNTSIDVFSYGILIIEIFCGQSPAPHDGPSRYESGRLVAVSEAERRRKFIQAMGDDHPLMNLTLKCISNNPDERPQSEEIVNELEGKESIVQPSFKQRLDTLKYVAVGEAEKSISKRKDKVKVQGKKGTMSTVHIPATYLYIALLVGFFSIFIAFNAGVLNERNQAKAGPISTKAHVYTEINSDFLQLAQNFVSTTFGECTLGETIACDRVVPTVLRDLGRILWMRGKSLQTSVYQGHTVVIGDRVYYGGGIAEKQHEHIVYCYHIRSDDWTSLDPLPIKSFGLGKFNGKLIALGGMTRQDEENTKVYTFDDKSNSWISGAIPNISMSRVFPEVLSLPSALVVAGGQSIQYYRDYSGYYWERSIEVYTQKTGWYWSDQPLPDSGTDLTLTASGNNCFVLMGNYSKAYIYLDWISHKSPLSLYVPIENILWDRNKTAPGRAYEYRDKLIFPSYRWKQLPGSRTSQASSLVATVLAGNLITLGAQRQKGDSLLRMYSLTNESWTKISQLPDNLDGATVTALSSTELLVTGNKEGGLLSVYRGFVQISQPIPIPPGPISSKLFKAIELVESNGDINAVGDGGNAIGPFQIRKQYWKVAVDVDPNLTANGETYQNCKGPESELYSMRVMQVNIHLILHTITCTLCVCKVGNKHLRCFTRVSYSAQIDTSIFSHLV